MRKRTADKDLENMMKKVKIDDIKQEDGSNAVKKAPAKIPISIIIASGKRGEEEMDVVRNTQAAKRAAAETKDKEAAEVEENRNLYKFAKKGAGYNSDAKSSDQPPVSTTPKTKSQIVIDAMNKGPLSGKYKC